MNQNITMAEKRGRAMWRYDMNFITENWFAIVAATAVVGTGGYAVYRFTKLSYEAQKEKVKEWLLYAVTMAEKELGGGTGQIKLRYVYDMFVARFTWIAKAVSFERFSDMVDGSLDKMKELLEKNKAVQDLVNGEAGEAH